MKRLQLEKGPLADLERRGDWRAVDQLVASMWGERALALLLDPGAILQVAAVWRNDERNVVMAIDERTPTSVLDGFILGLARARADCILTSGSILRAEPEVRHDLAGAPVAASLLASWRAEHLPTANKSNRPRLGVLTSGRGFDLRHPALAQGDGGTGLPTTVLTDRAGERRLQALFAKHRGPVPTELEVECLEPANPETALTALVEAGGGGRRATVELGPSSVRWLWNTVPPRIDLLLLSSWQGGRLPPSLEAGELPSRSALRATHEIVGCAERGEESGPWAFELWRSKES